MAAWRLAEAIRVLREECNALAPGRNRASDGTIGDAAHAARTSDHNPYIKDGNGVGVVRAFDVTHDPKGGLDAGQVAEHVRRLGKAGDPRVRYVIWDRRIASRKQDWTWRTYSGKNAHDRHAHISVVEDPRGYDSTARWGLAATIPEEDDMTPEQVKQAVLEALAEGDRLVEYGGHQWLIREVLGKAVRIRTGDDFERLLRAYKHAGKADELSRYELIR